MYRTGTNKPKQARASTLIGAHPAGLWHINSSIKDVIKIQDIPVHHENMPI